MELTTLVHCMGIGHPNDSYNGPDVHIYGVIRNFEWMGYILYLQNRRSRGARPADQQA